MDASCSARAMSQSRGRYRTRERKGCNGPAPTASGPRRRASTGCLSWTPADFVFEATSAKVHAAAAPPVCRGRHHRDRPHSRLGRPLRRPVNATGTGAGHPLVSCAGRATIDRRHAINAATDAAPQSESSPILCKTASRGRTISQFTEKTSRALARVAGSRPCQGDLDHQPGRASDEHRRTTVTTRRRSATPGQRSSSAPWKTWWPRSSATSRVTPSSTSTSTATW